MIDYRTLAKNICDKYPDKVQQYKETKTGEGYLLAILLNEYKQKISPSLMLSELKIELESR